MWDIFTAQSLEKRKYIIYKNSIGVMFSFFKWLPNFSYFQSTTNTIMSVTLS